MQLNFFISKLLIKASKEVLLLKQIKLTFGAIVQDIKNFVHPHVDDIIFGSSIIS